MSRITSAYQQFSQQVRRTGDLTGPGQVQGQSRTREQSGPEQSQSTSRTHLSREQRQQVRQLRETGTLENLSTILSEDEEILLGRLFGGNFQSYDASAGAKRQANTTVPSRGGIVDTRM